MKVALITDTHWGVRNDSIAFLNYFKKFYLECFFKYLDEHGITTVIHCGDVMERRKYVNIYTQNQLREIFLEECEKRSIRVIVTIGNHDTYFKNTNKVNSLTELTVGRPWFELYLEATEIELDGTKVLLMPWICADNRDSSLDAIAGTDSQIVIGHLELSGFEMYKGAPQSHGDDPKIFEKFDMVLTGHYHHKSDNGNIHYLGACCEYTWSDFDDDRGFHVLDTNTRELTFVKNPFKMFRKAFYDDEGRTLEEILDTDFSVYDGCMVKVVVKSKTNPYWFDQFIDKLEKAGPIDLQVVEDHLHLDMEDDEDIVSEAESTLDIFRKYIGQLNMLDDDKVFLESTIIELYNEALAVE